MKKTINNSNKLKDYPIIELSVEDIKKDPSNPNTMTLEQSRGLEKSMMNFGRLKHIVVDQNNVLIDGEHRLEVEKAIGTSKINVIQVNVKDEIERKIMRETLNKLHGQYDKQKESSELLVIFENQRLDELAELLAQPKQELENLITKYNPEVKFEREEDENKLPSLYDTESFVKRGEIWKLGRHYLMCGDSTNKQDTNKLIDIINDNNNNKRPIIPFVFTDPPYNIGFKYNEYQDKNPETTYETFCNQWFDNMINIIKPRLLVFTPGPRNISIYDNIKKFDDIGIWYKPNSRSGSSMFYFRRCEPILFYGDLANNKNKRTDDYFNYNMQSFKDLNEIEQQEGVENHAPAKTIDLLVDIIKNYTKEHDIVVDVFLGSGSTIIACEQTNRKCYGIELDEKYCSVIIKRWELYTGQKAQKIS